MTAPTDVRQTILDAMNAEPSGGLTAREISEATGVKYSTVTEHLRSLETDGHAAKEKSGRQVTWTRVPTSRDEARDEAGMERETDGGVGTYSGGFDVVDDDGPSLTDGQHPVARRAASETGARVVDEVAEDAGPVPVREDPEPSETAANASDALVDTDAPADAVSPAHVDLNAAAGAGDVLAFMEQENPIPVAPAEPEKARRTRTPGPAREVRNDFGSGGLQGEVLKYMDEHRNDDGTYKEYGPYELAVAVGAHASSVAYSLKQTTYAKGQTVQTGTTPPRFRLATSEEAAAFVKPERPAREPRADRPARAASTPAAPATPPKPTDAVTITRGELKGQTGTVLAVVAGQVVLQVGDRVPTMSIKSVRVLPPVVIDPAAETADAAPSDAV